MLGNSVGKIRINGEVGIPDRATHGVFGVEIVVGIHAPDVHAMLVTGKFP